MTDRLEHDWFKDLIDKTLGPYQIKEKVGQGGMAHVFRAYQPALDRYVAIKVLAPALADEPGFTERFKREARAVARMNHPNILQVYDFGVEDEFHYIVMRYVAGSPSLHTLMQRGEAVEKLIDYILQVADALNYAHQQGIIHRDVKPSNILIDGKWALLSDFGLVLDTASTSDRLTMTGRGIGTAAYISPEQARGDDVDRRTDIYALGVILYEVLTGTIPHNAPTPLALVARRVTEPVPPLRQFKPNIPESLENATLRALVRNPDYRYSSAVEFSESIRKAQTDPGSPHEGPLATQAIPSPPATISAAPPATQASPPVHPRPKKLGLAIGSSVVAALLIGLFFWNAWATNRSNQAAISPAVAVSPGRTAPPETPVASTVAIDAAPPTTPATPAPATSPVVAAKANLQVRAGPGDIYELLGYLPSGTQANIAGRDESGEWWRIETILGSAGYGWIRAGDSQADLPAADGVPIALSPPSPTFTPAATPQRPTATRPPPATDTPAPPATPSATATSAPTTAPGKALTPSPTAAAPGGDFTLLQPSSLEQPTFGVTEFEWRWNGPLPEKYGFEVRIWQDGEAPAGVHNAVLDNKSGTVQALGNNTYRLVADITDTPGVQKQRGEYNWTVVLVQIDPDYQDLGIQAPPGRLRYEPPFGRSSSGNEGDGGSGGKLN